MRRTQVLHHALACRSDVYWIRDLKNLSSADCARSSASAAGSWCRRARCRAYAVRSRSRAAKSGSLVVVRRGHLFDVHRRAVAKDRAQLSHQAQRGPKRSRDLFCRHRVHDHALSTLIAALRHQRRPDLGLILGKGGRDALAFCARAEVGLPPRGGGDGRALAFGLRVAIGFAINQSSDWNPCGRQLEEGGATGGPRRASTGGWKSCSQPGVLDRQGTRLEAPLVASERLLQ